MNIKSGEIENFEEFSQFKSLKEFNHHVEMWLSAHKDHFSNGELVGLKRLVRFSAKIPGVCNAKIGTVLKAIHEDYNEYGISRSTFKRMVQKAITLGLITVYETERKNGSQTSNLYVFNRFPTSEPPKQEKLPPPKETSNPSKTKEQKINIRPEESSNLDFHFVSDRVPQPFVQLVKVFFSEAKTIEEYWRMTQIAAYRNNFEKERDKVLVIAMTAFRQLIRKLKTNQIVRNQIAYFYGILDQKFEELFVKELVEMEE